MVFVVNMMGMTVTATQTPDDPILGASVSYLSLPSSSSWRACSNSLSRCIPATVPGDIITDLVNYGLLEDILVDLNFQNDTLWQDNDWTYESEFSLTNEQSDLLISGGDVLLVFDGVKMGAHVALDGKPLGDVTDQFLRYSFSLANFLRSHFSSSSSSSSSSSVPSSSSSWLSPVTTHTLTVAFDFKINTTGRFMACTGGWDWAPYALPNRVTFDTAARTFSYGIWRHVYLVSVASTSIEYVVPQIFYVGDYPVTPLVDGQPSFQLITRVHFYTSSSVTGQLTVNIAGLNTSSLSVTLAAGRSNVTLSFICNHVKLWWPNGYGAQTTYPLTVTFTPSSSSTSLSTARSIGFRFLSLVTGDDTDPAYVASASRANGNSDFGMRFRVNGVPTWLRGANWIPLEEVEGRNSDEAGVMMLQSAALAGMNVLRVWGGGIYYSDVMYTAADELGLLLYHDIMFAQNGHSPLVTATQDAEFRHQIRRLSHHPSILMYDGCNECEVRLDDPTAVYVTFVIATILQEDTSHHVWPSNPSYGWDSGVNQLTSLPNSAPLVPRVYNDSIYVFETHSPYQGGSGFPCVNGQDDIKLFDPMMPNSFNNQTKVGLSSPSVFVSEFGSIGFSSFHSLSAVISPSFWALHGASPPDTCVGGPDKVCTGNNVFAQRNYPCDNLIVTYFGEQDFETVNEKRFRGHLYECMLAQAFDVKGVIEQQRSQNVYGTIIWQLGEIWPTCGWGSLEYGSVGQKGQVVGGRWKPLHHFLRAFLYKDTFIACGLNSNHLNKYDDGKAGSLFDSSSLSCYLRNDAPRMLPNVRVVITSVALSDGSTTLLHDEIVASVGSGAGFIKWFALNSSQSIDATTHILSATVTQAGTFIAQNYNLLTIPAKLELSSSSVTATINDEVTTRSVTVHPHDKSDRADDGSHLQLPHRDVVHRLLRHSTSSVKVDVTNSGPGVALFVTLSTLAQGYFSENAFVLNPGSSRVLDFVFFGVADVDLLRSSLLIDHVAMYL